MIETLYCIRNETGDSGFAILAHALSTKIDGAGGRCVLCAKKNVRACVRACVSLFIHVHAFSCVRARVDGCARACACVDRCQS